jgi:CRP/FNR family transcriptional regulator, nitrogen fixation regulation protein
MLDLFDRYAPLDQVTKSTTVGRQASWIEFRYSRGAEIYGEAEPADYVYQIKSGAVRTFKLLPDGRCQIGAFHLRGDIFGIEIGDAHRFTAEAIVNTRVRMARREQVFAEPPERSVISGNDLLKLVAGSLQRAESHVLLLGRQNASERVATFLTEMDQRLGSPTALILPMGRRDIADYLGLTHETVTRSLSMLVREGILSIDAIRHREVVIHDKVKLARLAQSRSPTCAGS